MQKKMDYNLDSALSVYTEIFFKLTPEQQKKHKNEIDKYFACNEIGAMSFDDLLNPMSDKNEVHIVTCPKSKLHKIAKNGKTKSGRQRYICKDCGKTFYAVQDSLSSNVNQDMSKWINFIRGMLRQNSLIELSEDCNISKTTALSWRLRVFQALEILSDNVKLSGNIIADDTRFNYNLKGNHGDDFIMPRSSRVRGGSYTKKSYNKNNICVLCAIDENGNSFSKIVGFGNPSSARICEGFKNKIDSSANNILVTDGAKYFKKTIDTYNLLDWKRKTTLKKGNRKVPDTTTPYHIQRINSYHSRLKRFIRNFNGVSSRFLPGYLLLFDYLQNNKNIDDTTLCREILCAMTTATKLSKEELERKYVTPVSNNPTEEIWEKKVPVLEQRIYIDWAAHMPINEIIKKYRINRRKIYTVKDKVEKYNLHYKIINKEFHAPTRYHPSRKNLPITNRDWEIFLKCYQQGISGRKLAIEYNISYQTVYNIVDAIKNRPEAKNITKYQRSKFLKPLIRNQTNCIERNNIIYLEYKFLKKTNTSQKDIFAKLATKYNKAPKYIENIIYSVRELDSNAEISYHWTEERKNLPPNEYYKFLQNRNRALISDINTLIHLYPQYSKMNIFKMISSHYNITAAQIDVIYYHQNKHLYIYDKWLEKHQITPPEQTREQELRK